MQTFNDCGFKRLRLSFKALPLKAKEDSKPSVLHWGGRDATGLQGPETES